MLQKPLSVPSCKFHVKVALLQGLKPLDLAGLNVGAEAPTPENLCCELLTQDTSTVILSLFASLRVNSAKDSSPGACGIDGMLRFAQHDTWAFCRVLVEAQCLKFALSKPMGSETISC